VGELILNYFNFIESAFNRPPVFDRRLFSAGARVGGKGPEVGGVGSKKTGVQEFSVGAISAMLAQVAANPFLVAARREQAGCVRAVGRGVGDYGSLERLKSMARDFRVYGAGGGLYMGR